MDGLTILSVVREVSIRAAAELQPMRGQGWQSVRPTEMTTFWLCLGATVFTVIIGFRGALEEDGRRAEADEQRRN